MACAYSTKRARYLSRVPRVSHGLHDRQLRRLLHLDLLRHPLLAAGAVVVLLERPLVVHLRVQRERLHAERREEADRGDADAHLPHDAQAAPERVAHLLLQRLLQRADLGDRGVRDGHATREARDELGGESVRKLGLQHCGAD